MNAKTGVLALLAALILLAGVASGAQATGLSWGANPENGESVTFTAHPDCGSATPCQFEFLVDGVVFRGRSATAAATKTFSTGSYSITVKTYDRYAVLKSQTSRTLDVSGAGVAGQYCFTRPKGSPILSDAEAAAMRIGHPAERVTANAVANATHPSAADLTSFRSAHAGFDGPAVYDNAVTGAATGTTDELISHMACKYGIDEDTIRADAMQESGWLQSGTGDFCNGVFTSLGIMQVKAPNLAPGCTNGWTGVYPMNRDSTAFNLDFYGSRMRECLDGQVNWWVFEDAGDDLSGCLGWWFSGSWHSAAGDDYAAQVQARLAARDWEGL